jgi:hypothetical protein
LRSLLLEPQLHRRDEVPSVAVADEPVLVSGLAVDVLLDGIELGDAA